MFLPLQAGFLVLQMAALGLSIPFDEEVQPMKRSNVPLLDSQTYKVYDWDDLCGRPRNNYQ